MPAPQAALVARRERYRLIREPGRVRPGAAG